eukprot:Nk52_evm29s228 gene=Nk52_evmTU29s228
MSFTSHIEGNSSPLSESKEAEPSQMEIQEQQLFLESYVQALEQELIQMSVLQQQQQQLQEKAPRNDITSTMEDDAGFYGPMITFPNLNEDPHNNTVQQQQLQEQMRAKQLQLAQGQEALGSLKRKRGSAYSNRSSISEAETEDGSCSFNFNCGGNNINYSYWCWGGEAAQGDSDYSNGRQAKRPNLNRF